LFERQVTADVIQELSNAAETVGRPFYVFETTKQFIPAGDHYAQSIQTDLAVTTLAAQIDAVTSN